MLRYQTVENSKLLKNSLFMISFITTVTTGSLGLASEHESMPVSPSHYAYVQISLSGVLTYDDDTFKLIDKNGKTWTLNVSRQSFSKILKLAKKKASVEVTGGKSGTTIIVDIVREV